MLAVTVAESLGFVVPALTGAATGGRYRAMVAAGAVALVGIPVLQWAATGFPRGWSAGSR